MLINLHITKNVFITMFIPRSRLYSILTERLLLWWIYEFTTADCMKMKINLFNHLNSKEGTVKAFETIKKRFPLSRKCYRWIFRMSAKIFINRVFFFYEKPIQSNLTTFFEHTNFVFWEKRINVSLCFSIWLPLFFMLFFPLNIILIKFFSDIYNTSRFNVTFFEYFLFRCIFHLCMSLLLYKFQEIEISI